MCRKNYLKCSMLCILLRNWLLLRCKSIKVKILMCSFYTLSHKSRVTSSSVTG